MSLKNRLTLIFCNTLQKCLGKTRLPLTSIGKRFIVPECSLGGGNLVGIDVNATPELRSEAAEEIDQMLCNISMLLSSLMKRVSLVYVLCYAGAIAVKYTSCRALEYFRNRACMEVMP